tara:strand:+ start:427 stop:600 length:174 start_codon:yes stop_codon:yes gene_type:complete
MIQTVETEIVRAHTRLDGSDARLKRIEAKLERLTWLMGLVCGVASFLGPMFYEMMTR